MIGGDKRLAKGRSEKKWDLAKKEPHEIKSQLSVNRNKQRTVQSPIFSG